MVDILNIETKVCLVCRIIFENQAHEVKAGKKTLF